MKSFHITGTVIPEENYMVDITDKLIQIKAMIDKKEYFAINRGRQYGKTTTLEQLERYLQTEYTVINISFEGFDAEEFENAATFSKAFLKEIHKSLTFSNVEQTYRDSWLNFEIKSFSELSIHLTEMCKDKKVVLLIDEVDKVSNNRVFLGFLSKLREKYLARRVGKDHTFHSVILVGVYDVKNIKLKLLQEGKHTLAETETTANSPWNIAADFDVNMAFTTTEIQGMLNAYETDYKTGMNIAKIAQEIHNFTNGYPVLVSNICKHIDEKLQREWTTLGIRKAVKRILKENSPLFETLTKNLDGNEKLFQLVHSIVIKGGKWPFNIRSTEVNLGVRYGYFQEDNGNIKISNRMFEMCLLEYFTFLEKQKQEFEIVNHYMDNSGIVENGIFNMETCMHKFSNYYEKYYNKKDQAFIERSGRLLFLMFVSPILNGSGFAYIESQTADGLQTDVIINFLNQQFIVELKIWDGIKKHEKAYKQLETYMNQLNVNEGYLLTFNFNQKKETSIAWETIDEQKKILDVIL